MAKVGEPEYAQNSIPFVFVINFVVILWIFFLVLFWIKFFSSLVLYLCLQKWYLLWNPRAWQMSSWHNVVHVGCNGIFFQPFFTTVLIEVLLSLHPFYPVFSLFFRFPAPWSLLLFLTFRLIIFPSCSFFLRLLFDLLSPASYKSSSLAPQFPPITPYILKLVSFSFKVN